MKHYFQNAGKIHCVNSVNIISGQRERERETHTQRETERERDRERDRDTDTDTDRQTDRQTETRVLHSQFCRVYRRFGY